MTRSFRRLTRRDFIRYSAFATGALTFSGCGTTASTRPRAAARVGQLRKAGEKVNVACFAVGGKGWGEMMDMLNLDENVVAICDVDEERLNKAAAEVRKKNPNVRLYRDYRKLLDQEEKNIDAVTVSTPDHMHAPIAYRAITMGKHAFVQKPLTRTIHESRLLRDAARKHQVVTQMGNQGSANDGTRRGVEVIQAGVLGPVRELHVWSNRPIWPQGIERPEGSDPVPPSLDWDLWLGIAPQRPYKKDVYHPFKWRGWHDYGTGALGDMGCHTLNLPFRGLKLGYATEVEAEASDRMKETYPKASKVRFLFPAREGLEPVTLWWYDGGWKPHEDLTQDVKATLGEVPKSGCLLLGEKGSLFSADDYGSRNYMKLKGEPKMMGLANHEAAKAVPQSLPRVTNHAKEWVDAIKGGPAPYSNFEIAAYLTEIILVGCVALRAGTKLLWDGPNMKAKNTGKAAAFVKPSYRYRWF
jgi:predicted dehydrogenase